MKCKNLIAVSTLCLALFTGSAIFAQETATSTLPEEQGMEMPEFTLSIAIDSKDVSDGMVGNPDPILTETFEASWKGFYASITRIVDLTDYNGKDTGYNHSRRYQCVEMDYTLGYAYTFEKVAGISDLTVDLSIAYKDYPGLEEDPDEDIPANLVLTLDNVLPSEDWGLAPYAEFEYDFRHDDFCGVFGAELSKTINDQLTLTLATNWYWGSAHHNRDAYESDQAAVNAADFILGAQWSPVENITIQPYVAFSLPARSRVRECFKDDENNSKSNFWGGMALSWNF